MRTTNAKSWSLADQESERFPDTGMAPLMIIDRFSPYERCWAPQRTWAEKVMHCEVDHR